MSNQQTHNDDMQQQDGRADALAGIALVLIFVTTVVFWLTQH